MSEHKLEKFSQHIRALILVLMHHRNNLQIHSRIDQFYYMQKLEELKVLFEKAHEATLRLEQVYAETFRQWRNDIRFLNSVLKHQPEAKPRPWE